MAKNAEKRHAQDAAYWSSVMLISLIVINSLYFFVLLAEIKGRNFEWYYGDIIWLILYGWIEKKCYSMIVDELERGLTPNYSLDVFGVFVSSHLVSCFSTYYGSWVLYILPGYVLYKGGGFLMSYMSNKSKDAMTEEEKPDAIEAKRLAKKERKDARQEKMGGKVKYAKH